ncbi:MAG TPA: ABC transporter permease [Jatrophihabitans sp.]|nr:ABC transporter permease [Jatrophihabitans sp.]
MPDQPASPSRRRLRVIPRRRSRDDAEGAWYPRWYWPAFSLPGTLWMLVLFALPFYVVLSIAFGTVDPVFQSPVPVYQPWWWTSRYLAQEWHYATGEFRVVEIRTIVYVVLATAICLVIAYAVAYYVARFGGKRKGLFLALLIAPFFISYLMRMLSWVELLQLNGYVNNILTFLHITPHPINWLAGVPFTVVMGLVYGYIPYMILPLYGFLDRIDQSQLEAARDLGASPFRTFVRVTLPLSKPAILASLVIVTLPMFGDYYTNNLLSGSPKTTMYGNLLDNAMEASGQGPQAAVLVLFLVAFLMIPMTYYIRETAKAQRNQ